jgi:hypothetical protein
VALYHFTAKAVSRGKGQSAVHTAAYNAREQLHDERENRDTKDYGYKGKTEFSGIFAPKGAPEWAQDREQLWNRAEGAENRKDSQTARNVEFALPHELDAEQRKRLVTDFCRETFARRGMVADVSIHAPHDRNDDRNHHVHCLLTMRRLDGDGFAKTKERQWNSKAELEQWREKWAQMGGKALERAGHQQEADRFRHGHRTLAGQREAALARGDQEWAQHCDKEAQIHKGAAVSAMEQRDDPRLADNEIAREARAIDERNAARAEIRQTEKELAAAQREAEKQREPSGAKPEPEKAQAEKEQAEKERAQPYADRWQNRDATKMEEKIFHMQDAAGRGGQPLGAALWQEGISLARVDAAGIAMKDTEYQREFENEKLQGNDDARLRVSKVQEGELVAVTKSGDVFRLNPRFLELDRLEREAGTTPGLSATLDYFAAERQQQREDRQAAQHASYETREALHQQRDFAHDIRQGVNDVLRDITGESEGIKVVDTKGIVVSLGSFVESLFGMGAKPEPASPQQQQQRAFEALERIEESLERGDRLSAADVASLVPTQIENLHRHGDAYMREMIDDLKRYREQEQDYGRERERER